MYCQKCGQQISDGAQFCPQCGSQQDVVGGPPAMTLTTPTEDKNPMAIWGFVCALVGFLLPVPVIDILVSIAGTVISSMGVKKAKHRGLAIAGIVIGALGIIGALVILATDPDFYSEIWN